MFVQLKCQKCGNFNIITKNSFTEYEVMKCSIPSLKEAGKDGWKRCVKLVHLGWTWGPECKFPTLVLSMGSISCHVETEPQIDARNAAVRTQSAFIHQ